MRSHLFQPRYLKYSRPQGADSVVDRDLHSVLTSKISVVQSIRGASSTIRSSILPACGGAGRKSPSSGFAYGIGKNEFTSVAGHFLPSKVRLGMQPSAHFEQRCLLHPDRKGRIGPLAMPELCNFVCLFFLGLEVYAYCERLDLGVSKAFIQQRGNKERLWEKGCASLRRKLSLLRNVTYPETRNS